MKKLLIMIAISMLFISNSWGEDKCEGIDLKKKDLLEDIIHLESKRPECESILHSDYKNYLEGPLRPTICYTLEPEIEYLVVQLNKLNNMNCEK